MEENRIEQMLLEESLGGDRSEYQDCKGNLLELAKYFVEDGNLGDGDKLTHYWDGIGLRVTIEVGDYEEVGNRREINYSDR